MADTVRVQINPKAVNLQSVVAAVLPQDVLREKARIVKVTKREPVDVSAEGAAALKEAAKKEGIDVDGKEVEGVIDYVEPTPEEAQAQAKAHGGDMTAKDLEAGGKKPATKSY